MDGFSRRGFFGSGVAAATGFGFDLGPAQAAVRELKTSRGVRSKSTCPFCPVGCPVVIHTLGEKVVHIEGDPDSPVNRGKLCSKGASLKEIVTSGRRLTRPLHRAPGGADWQPRSWDQAITEMTRLIQSAQREGLDGNLAVLERPGPAPVDWARVAEAGAVLVIGSDPAENEPVGFGYVLKAKAKLVCVDPRFSRTAAMAGLHVPIRAGTEAAFLSGLVHYALTTERFRTPGAQQVELLKNHYAAYKPEQVAKICECTADEFRRAAEMVTGVCAVLAPPALARAAGVLQSLLGNDASLPHRDRQRTWGSLFDTMYRGGMEGLVSFGVNPLAEGPNTTKMREALAKLKWLIAADSFETGTAAFWRTDPAAIQTEVFLLPLPILELPGGARSEREILQALGIVPDESTREIAVDSALPEYFEPVESPVEGPNPTVTKFESAADRYGTTDKFPYVGITYRLSAPFQGNLFVEVPYELAAEKGIAPGETVRVSSARGQVEATAVVTKRLKARHVGLPIHWEFLGRDAGSLVHNLTASVYDSESGAPENRGFLVNLEKI